MHFKIDLTRYDHVFRVHLSIKHPKRVLDSVSSYSNTCEDFNHNITSFTKIVISSAALMLETVYKKICKVFVAAWAIEAEKKHYSQEAHFVNGQAIAVYLKMFKIVLSIIPLLNAFSWF